MKQNKFRLSLVAPLNYQTLVNDYTQVLVESEKRDELVADKVHEQHRAAIQKEWARAQGLSLSRRHPCVEALSGRTGNTSVLNQDHASVWNYNGKPVLLVSMPYVNGQMLFGNVEFRDFEQLHKIKCQRMHYPGWHNPPVTALDIWILDE